MEALLALLAALPSAACGLGFFVLVQAEPREAVGAWQIDAAIAADDRDTIFPALPGVTYEPGNHRIWKQEQARRGGAS